jgi:AcrR family transcriptional regulator
MDYGLQQRTRRKRRFPVGRPTAAQACLRTGDLLDAAWEVFIELGYQAASIAEIARRAGASKQTIYARFSTKAELFKAVIQRGSDRLQELFARILLPDDAVELVLLSYGENMAQIMIQPEAQRFFRTVVGAARDFPELAEFFWEHAARQGQKRLAEYLTAQTAKGALQVEDPVMAARLFDSLCTGPAPALSSMGLAIPCDYATLHRYVKEAVRIFLAAYGV